MKRAHDIDANLSAHVMHENLVSKASSVLALLNVIHVTGIDRNQSTTPCFIFFGLTMMRSGMPSRSASANITPALTLLSS